jgi:hypothetical protein
MRVLEGTMQLETYGVRVAEHYACVLFDKKTGAIAHIHESITFEGVTPPSKDDVASRAIELAREYTTKLPGIKVDRLEVLHVRPEELIEGESLKVDLKSRRLVLAAKRKSPRGSKKRLLSRK